MIYLIQHISHQNRHNSAEFLSYLIGGKSRFTSQTGVKTGVISRRSPATFSGNAGLG
nr:MAG TPA: hypothetical protein [Caudoviricetes sp.]